jgi:LMBR1 domain-containing protein 1
MNIGSSSSTPHIRKIKEIYEPRVSRQQPLTAKSIAGFYIEDEFDTHLQSKRILEEQESQPKAFRIAKSARPSSTRSVSSFKKKAQEELMKKVNCLGEGYSYTFDFNPTVSFFKFLCVAPRFQSSDSKLQIWVPDTIVHNDTNRPYWIYSNLDGEVCRIEQFEAKHVFDKLKREPEEICAVLKIQQYDAELGRVVGNKSTALPTNLLKEKVRLAWKGDANRCCIQKFIKCRGPRPFICRSVYTLKNQVYGWLITSNDVFSENHCLTEAQNSIIKVKSGRFIEESSRYIERMRKYLEHHLRVQFQELVCDFIKDEGGLMWLINVKAFKLYSGTPKLEIFTDAEMESDKVKSTRALKEYKKIKRCEFCHVGFETLSHELTLKMIFEMEDHLRHRGIVVSWLQQKEFRFIDEATLYQNYSVCDYCFKLYTETQVLKSLEVKFARAMGIPSKSKETPQTFELIPEVPMRVLKDDPTSHDKFYILDKFRVLVILHEITEFNLDSKSNYKLEYEFLNESIKYRVRVHEANLASLSRLRMFYIFSNGRNAFCSFLRKQQYIQVNLFKDEEKLASIKLPLQDFRSPYVIKKSFYEPFLAKTGPFLRAHIGIMWDSGQKVSQIKLRAYNGIYLPPQDYRSPDSLPEEWLEILPEVKYPVSNITSRAMSLRISDPSDSPKNPKGRISLNSKTYRSIRYS